MLRRCVFLACLLATAARVGPAAAAGGERPNVVLIVWNDATLERVGFLGANPQAVTPELDGLLAGGALFPHGTLSSPRGRTTISAVLSGRDAQQTGIFSKTAPQALPPAGTLGVLFRAQG